jgi:hypothetical protein
MHAEVNAVHMPDLFRSTTERTERAEKGFVEKTSVRSARSVVDLKP